MRRLTKRTQMGLGSNIQNVSVNWRRVGTMPTSPPKVAPMPAATPKVAPMPAAPAKVAPMPATPAKVAPMPAAPAKVAPMPETAVGTPRKLSIIPRNSNKVAYSLTPGCAPIAPKESKQSKFGMNACHVTQPPANTNIEAPRRTSRLSDDYSLEALENALYSIAPPEDQNAKKEKWDNFDRVMAVKEGIKTHPLLVDSEPALALHISKEDILHAIKKPFEHDLRVHVPPTAPEECNEPNSVLMPLFEDEISKLRVPPSIQEIHDASHKFSTVSDKTSPCEGDDVPKEPEGVNETKDSSCVVVERSSLISTSPAGLKWSETSYERVSSVSELFVVRREKSTVSIILQQTPLNVEQMIQALNMAINQVESLPDTARVYLVDETDRKSHDHRCYFTTVMDEIEATVVERHRIFEMKENLFQRIASSNVTFAAILKGNAFGFAAELVASCTIVISNDTSASIGFPNLQHGVLPSHTSVSSLRKKMGFRKCAEVLRALHERSFEDLLDLNLIIYDESDNKTSKDIVDAKWPLYFESKIFELISSKYVKEYITSWLLPRDHTLMSDRTIGTQFSSEWLEYLMISTVSPNPEIDCRNFAITHINSRSASNAAECRRLYYKCARGSLACTSSPLPRELIQFKRIEANLWNDRIDQVNGASHQTLLFDCSSLAINVTLKLITELRRIKPRCISAAHILLIGDMNNCRKALDLLDTAAVISPAPPLLRSGLNSFQELSAFYREESSIKAKDVTDSAVRYVQSQDMPFIFSKGGAIDRMIAAFAAEACRLAALQVTIEEIDSAAVNTLGMAVGPFQLMDFYGTSNVMAMIDSSPSIEKMERLPLTARCALNAMIENGFLGNENVRGGFYKMDAQGIFSTNDFVYRTFLSRRPSHDDVANRLFFALVIECCEMLLDGTLQSSEDADLLSVAIGFPPSQGGVLKAVDEQGLERTLEKMSSVFGPSFVSNRLMTTMISNKQTFSSLTLSTVVIASKLNKLDVI